MWLFQGAQNDNTGTKVSCHRKVTRPKQSFLVSIKCYIKRGVNEAQSQLLVTWRSCLLTLAHQDRPRLVAHSSASLRERRGSERLGRDSTSSGSQTLFDESAPNTRKHRTPHCSLLKTHAPTLIIQHTIIPFN